MTTLKDKVHEHYAQLAKQYQLNFVTLMNVDIDPHLLKKHQQTDYLQLQALPISQTETVLTIATANPSDINQEKIREFWGNADNKKIEIVVTSRQDISHALAHRFKKELTHDITYKRFDIDPAHSASYSFSLAEKIILLSGIALIVAGIVCNYYISLIIILLFLAMGTVVVVSYKMGLTLRIFRWPQNKAIKNTTQDVDLPIYTILIPLLREKEKTITMLLESLHRLDYPPEKLDIKLLLEEDDLQTLKTINQFSLPFHYDVLIVPPGLPRSKPRACNYGLYLAFGKYLVIYDAEDRPDSNQLKQALKRFEENDKDTVCIQAALNFYNYKENLLTRLFTIEYSYWFDMN